MTGLQIPDAALNAATSAAYSFSPDSDEALRLRTAVTAAAPAIVAAELRRLAALLDETDDVRKLLARADELDGGAR